jgi:hypothetical protein
MRDNALIKGEIMKVILGKIVDFFKALVAKIKGLFVKKEAPKTRRKKA